MINPWTGKLMQNAVDNASKVANLWEDLETRRKMDDYTLWSISVDKDSEDFLDIKKVDLVPDDNPDSYYIVSPEGAIGHTEDAGQHIKWLYNPLGHVEDDLPVAWVKETAWPTR